MFWPAEAEAEAAAEQRARVIEHRCAAATRCAMLKRLKLRFKIGKTQVSNKHLPPFEFRANLGQTKTPNLSIMKQQRLRDFNDI